MQRTLLSALLGGTAIVSGCIVPTTVLSNTITTPFRIQVQNISYPAVHDFYMNLLEAGGGDKHLYIGPVGTPTFDLVLTDGIIEQNTIHAVIGGEHSTIDNTDKMFMTERGDSKAIFQPTYGCNPETDALQVELTFLTWEDHDPGQWICVRPTYDNAYEFRYYPPGDTANDPDKFCIKVTLVVLITSPSSTSISGSTTSSASVGSGTAIPTSTSSTSVAISTVSTLPFTDMTSAGFSFVGCAPEERTDPTGTTGRTLSGDLYADDALTEAQCLAFCTEEGYEYAGTEYARECWCGSSYPPSRQPGTTIASLTGCSKQCSGNITEICGGSDWLSLYRICAKDDPCINSQFT